MLIIQKPASENNFSKGRAWQSITHVVIHIEQGYAQGTIAEFAAPQSKVSAHYSISKAGTIYQHVKEQDTAWHAGILAPFKWLDATRDPHRNCNPNAFSIGIEHEGFVTDPSPWPDAQVQASALLVADICRRNKILIDRQHVVRHGEIGGHPGCPGDRCPIDHIVTKASVL